MSWPLRGFQAALVFALVVGFCTAVFSVAFEIMLINGWVYSTSLESLLPLFGAVSWPGYEIPEALGWLVALNATHVRGFYLFQNFLVFGGTIFLYWLLLALAVWYALSSSVKLLRWGRGRLGSR